MGDCVLLPSFPRIFTQISPLLSFLFFLSPFIHKDIRTSKDVEAVVPLVALPYVNLVGL